MSLAITGKLGGKAVAGAALTVNLAATARLVLVTLPAAFRAVDSVTFAPRGAKAGAYSTTTTFFAIDDLAVAVRSASCRGFDTLAVGGAVPASYLGGVACGQRRRRLRGHQRRRRQRVRLRRCLSEPRALQPQRRGCGHDGRRRRQLHDRQLLRHRADQHQHLPDAGGSMQWCRLPVCSSVLHWARLWR